MIARVQVSTNDAAVERARFYSADNNFEFSWPPVPARQFIAERDLAFAQDTPTGFVALDASDDLGTAYPATTPTLLLRYVRLRAGEPFFSNLSASGEIYYVMQGTGHSCNADITIEWGPGDLFCFPGGNETIHQGDTDSTLCMGTNEPLLALERLRPPFPGAARVAPVHWKAEAIERELAVIFERPITAQTTGHAVLFSSDALAPSTNALPSINVGLNTLEAGKDQRPHRHNGVAVTLCLQGDGVYSMIDGERIDWADRAVQITPAASLHSHHNRGSDRMRCLIFQDEALHYYTRTPGFSFE